MRRIGLLRSETGVGVGRPLIEALVELGYRPGENLEVETRVVAAEPDAFQRGADELVRANVEVLVAVSTPAARAARKATHTIPIVMAAGNAPVELGLVASLARPGGNVTGLTTVPGTRFYGKMLELLKEAAPRLTRVAVVMDPTTQSSHWPQTQTAARALGLAAFPVTIERPNELLAQLREGRPDGFVALPTAQVNALTEQLVEFARSQRLPSMFGTRRAVEIGGMLMYWTSWAELGRKAARMVDRILKGARPAEMPIEQPERFELIVNARTMEALGLPIPRSLLLQAHEVLR